MEAVEEEGDLALVKASAHVLVLTFGTTEPNLEGVEGIASTSGGSINPLGVHQEKVYELIVAGQQTYANWVPITSNLH
jgi:hypothetical protein